MGAPLPFRFCPGKAVAGAAFTLPLIFSITGDFVAFEYTVILLFMFPTFLVLYLITIISDLPGNTGCLGHAGTVQPQLALTFESTRGSFPLLVNVNSQLPSAPLARVP